VGNTTSGAAATSPASSTSPSGRTGSTCEFRLADPAHPKQCLLVVMGATADGQKELIAVIDGVRESKQRWLDLLLDLKNRGLTIPPTIAVADGALGFWAALREAYPTTREQRCSSPQDRQRHQLHAQGDPTESEVRPPPDLARRNQGDGQQGLRSLPGEVRASFAMMVKFAESAARRWRRLNASHQLTLVIQGRIFTDGVLQNAA